MLGSFSLTEGLRRLSLGRIIYCVFAAFPVAISLSLLLNPAMTHEDELMSGMLFLLMLILDVPILLVGLSILIWKVAKRRELVFWSFAVLIALIPIITLVAMMAANRLSNFKIPA